MNNLKYQKFLSLILLFVTLTSFWGGFVYRLYALNTIGIGISLFLTVASFFILQSFLRKNNDFKEAISEESPRFSFTYFIPYSIYVILWGFAFYILIAHRTAISITSPWQVVPNYFFVFYTLASAALFWIILRRKCQFNIFLVQAHFFLSFSVAFIIYKIGYGFDPFIHQATEDIIAQNGVVFPKPFYYLGQYSLIVILNKLTFLSIPLLDKFLVPLCAALFLPWAASKFLNNSSKKNSLFTSILLLAIPAPFFIMTAPQNLAYLFLIILILLGFAVKDKKDLIIPYALALAALLTQPIAGIPALIYCLILTIKQLEIKGKRFFFLAFFLLTIVALPFSFYNLEKNSFTFEQAVNFALDKIINFPNIFHLPGQENFLLNFIYFYGFNLAPAIISLAIVGFFIGKRKENIIFLIMPVGLVIAYSLTQLLPFNFLINYERENYSQRIILMAAFFLLPFILNAFHFFTEKLLKEPNKNIKIPVMVFIVFTLTASIYLSYPRFDNYHNSRGLSTGIRDLEAVNFIEQTHKDNYIVLANQQVSAAALHEFGFKKYYASQAEPIFFYPVPTGGPLYQFYLDMVYKKPSRETMMRAMDLAGVNEGYFVLNKYWWAFQKISDEAKLEADSWEKIGNGEIYIFKYENKKPHLK